MYLSNQRLAQLSVAVLLMYVMIFSNGVKSIVGCNIRHALSTNFLVQHLTAFLILLFFIVVTTKETNQGSFAKNFVFSVLVYIWFAMLTRVRIEMFLVVLILLLIAYALGTNNMDENKMEETESHEIIKREQRYQITLVVLSLLITVSSFAHYIYSKMTRYGKAYSWQKFLTKPPKCKLCKMSLVGSCV